MKMNYAKLMQGLDFSTFVLAKYHVKTLSSPEEGVLAEPEFIIPN
ncbi:MAG TPA: hypothetical protein VJC16_01810 [Candidatus Nanoarchaeia archaeon]|nr:hypothetical protein [Candidatus Nanoarchaeia archaeon]